MGRFKFLGLGWMGKKESKRKNPEEEDGMMIEMKDMSEGPEVPKKEPEKEQDEEPEIIREEEPVKVPEDPEIKKKRDAARSELDFARSLYDSEPVKREGKKAFSKISTLLVRYNRLHEVKQRQKEESERIKQKASNDLKAAMDEIAEYAEEARRSQVMSEEEVKQTDIKVQAAREKAKRDFEAEMERANNVSKYLSVDLLAGIDRDKGGIRAALMLGGDSAFGKGYTMTDGSFEDVVKAGNYVKDVAGEQGTLMEQMSLLDNAVNTGGIDMDAGNSRGETDGVAHFNLSDIFRSITDDDARKLNFGNRSKLNLDMDLIKKSREDNTMDSLLGKQKKMKTVSEAAEKRGVFYQTEKTGEKSVKQIQRGLTKEAMLRKSGKDPGRYAQSNFPKMSQYAYRNATTFMNKGFFGDLWSIDQGRAKTRGRNADERRAKIRQARMDFNASVIAAHKDDQIKRVNNVNKKDQLADEMEMFKAEEVRSREELVKAGLLDNASLEEFRKKDDVDIMQERLKNAKKDNSAGHMLAAYKMMGASRQELLDFRLALIAYMVPIGKNTVAGIVNESHAVGVVGAEGSENIGADADMDRLYRLLKKSSEYVKRLDESEADRSAYKWSVDKKRYRRKEDGSLEETEEKPAEKKDKLKNKAIVEWNVSDSAGFDIVGEENKDPLFGENNEIKVSDVKQGDAGNSWLMAPLAALAQTDPDYIRNKLIKPQDDNLVRVRLFDEEGNYNFIVVSKNSVKGGSNESALWVRVVEKAAAVLRDSAGLKDNPKIDMGELKNGNIALGMSMLLGKGANKQISLKKEDAQAGKEEMLTAIRDAVKNKKILTISTGDGPEKELRELGLNKAQNYTILGEGENKDGEETIRIRDTHGTATAKKVVSVVHTDAQEGKPVHRSMNIKLFGFEDGIIELKASDLVKYCTALNVGERVNDGKEDPEEPLEKEEKEEKEELLDQKAAFTAQGVAEGAEVMGKWQELGNKLWKLAYVEMGKEYLDGVLSHVDKLLSALTEKLPSGTGSKLRKSLAERHAEIAGEYKAIAINGMTMASELPGKIFDESDEAAAAAKELVNLALEEGRYFNIGAMNTIRHTEDSEDLKQRRPWVSVIIRGKNDKKNMELMAEERKRSGKETAEERKRRREEKAQGIDAFDLMSFFGDDKEEEKPKKQDGQGEKEPPVHEEGDKGPDKEEKPEDKGPLKEEKPEDKGPLKEEKPEDKGPNKEEKPEDKTGSKKEAAVQKPLDAQGYSRRWSELGDKLKELSRGKMSGANVLFLGGGCAQLSKKLSEQLPKDKNGNQTTTARERLFIEAQYKNIRQIGAEVLADLAEKEFDGSREIADHVIKILECNKEETESFDIGRNIVTAKKAKDGLTWGDVLVAGKKDTEAHKAMLQFTETAVIVGNGAGSKKPVEMKEMGEAKVEQPQKEKDMFGDAVVLEKSGADYIASWKALKQRVQQLSSTKFNEKNKDHQRAIRFTNSLVQAVDGVIRMLGLNVASRAGGKGYLISKQMCQACFNQYNAIKTFCSAIANEMLRKQIEGGEAVKILGQIIKKSTQERKYLTPGIRAASKQPGKKLIWADFLVYGKQSADASKASQPQKAGQGAGGQPKKKEVPKVGQPKNEEPPKAEPPKIEVEQPKNEEPPKVEPPKIEVEQPKNEEPPKAEPPKIEVEQPKNEEPPKVEPPKIEVEQPKNEEPPKAEPPKIEVEQPKNEEPPKAEPPKIEVKQPKENDQDQDEEEPDEDDELLKELEGDEPIQLDDDEADKGIHDLEQELEDGDFDEDPEMKKLMDSDPELKKVMDESGKLQKKLKEVGDLLAGRKIRKDRKDKEDGKGGIRRTGTVRTEGRKKQKERITRTKTADPTRLVNLDALMDEDAEMKALDKSAKTVGDQSFMPITTAGKVKNRAVLATEYLLGAAMLPINLIATGIGKLMLIYQKHKRTQELQPDRKKDSITVTPGRSKTSLEEKEAPKDAEGNEQVYDDTRNVPLVWEFVTAGDPEEAPEMSINMEQPKPGTTTATTGTNPGHGFIGLSYSRFNLSTNRKERYRVEYGFQPKDGFGGIASSMIMTTGAYIPGVLKNNRDNPYTVSKKYSIDNETVNKVLKASEKFPAQGYSVYKRNCVTFVVEMGKIAGLPIADQIKETEYDVGKIATAGAVLTGGFIPSARYNAERDFEIMLTKKDTSYQDFGQKVATTEELSKYKKTRKLMNSTPYGYSPAVAGETLRHDVAGGGEFGARLGAEKESFENSISISEKAIGHEDKIVLSFMEQLKEKFNGDGTDQKRKKEEVQVMIEFLNKKDGWTRFAEFASKDFEEGEQNPVVIREIRKSLNDHRKTLGLFISKNPEFTNDVLNDVLQLMDMYELSIRILDEQYQKVMASGYTGELADIKKVYMNMPQSFKYTDSKNVGYEIVMEPNLIEAYLQIYGSMGKAAPYMARYTMYKDAFGMAKTQDEKDEVNETYADAVAAYELAKQFADSHRYRLNRTTFDHDEMQYAFDTLPQMEEPGKDEKVEGPMKMLKTSPSAMFQSLIYGTAFKGFSEGIKDIRSGKSVKEIAEWANEKLIACAQDAGNRAELRKILKYHYDASVAKDEINVASNFIKSLNDSFIRGVFRNELDDDQLLDNVISELAGLEVKGSGFMGILTELLKDIKKEGKKG